MRRRLMARRTDLTKYGTIENPSSYCQAYIGDRMNDAEGLDKPLEMDDCRNHHRDMKNLMTGSPDVESVWCPSLGNLLLVNVCLRSTQHRACTHPGCVYGRAEQIGSRHPAHEYERHARSLDLPSINP